MGTNYHYYEKPPCAHCGQTIGEGTHIGKASSGWVFSLHVYPADGIRDLEDWEARWRTPGSYIQSEYGEPLTPEEMQKIITERSWDRRPPARQDRPRTNPWLDGPNGLLRHPVEHRCIKHGAGTWDCMVGGEDYW